jgi:hypothetical protein
MTAIHFILRTDSKPDIQHRQTLRILWARWVAGVAESQCTDARTGFSSVSTRRRIGSRLHGSWKVFYPHHVSAVRSGSKCGVEFSVSRDQNSIDRFGQGQVETIIQTSVGLTGQRIRCRENPFIGMPLEREMFQLLQDRVAFMSCEFHPSDFLSQHIA